jgi:hypothetical protein
LGQLRELRQAQCKSTSQALKRLAPQPVSDEPILLLVTLRRQWFQSSIMKTGFKYALITLLLCVLLPLLFGFILRAQNPNSVNAEALGNRAGRLLVYLVPAAFVVGLIRQSSR